MENVNLEIRNFCLGDEKEILEIHKEGEIFFEDFPISENFIVETALRNDFRIFVAENKDNKGILGFIGVLFHSNVGRAEIGPIAVRKNFREKKIGTELLSHAINFLKEIGIRRVTVRVKENNLNALKFFRKFNFLQEGYFKDYTKNHENVVQMVKFLY